MKEIHGMKTKLARKKRVTSRGKEKRGKYQFTLCYSPEEKKKRERNKISTTNLEQIKETHFPANVEPWVRRNRRFLIPYSILFLSIFTLDVFAAVFVVVVNGDARCLSWMGDELTTCIYRRVECSEMVHGH